MTRWETRALPVGGRVQSGIPRRRVGDVDRMRGMLLRGVVVATYVLDDSNHPEKALDEGTTPAAIYCDVLTYSSMMNQQTVYLRACLVSQEIGGMHRGRIWKPRAAQIDKTENAIDLNGPTNVANLDGDHVLVGFYDDNPNTPIILRGVPHPSADEGNQDLDIGNRLRLVDGDGDPDLFKHHGTFYGVADNGDFVVDTRFANAGNLDSQAKEPDPPTDGTGAYRINLPKDAPFKVVFHDMADKLNPEEKARLTFTEKGLALEYVDSGLIFDLSDENDRVKVTTAGGLEFLIDGKNDIIELGAEGSGDYVPLDSLVQENLVRIRNEMDTLADEVRAHEHPLPYYLLQGLPEQTSRASLVGGLTVGVDAKTQAPVKRNWALVGVDASSEDQNQDPTILRGELQIPVDTTPTDTKSATAKLRS